MALVRKTLSLFFNSDAAAGARNVSKDGSEFSIQLNSPITLPYDAVGANLSVQQATIWNNSYNISDELQNNKLRVVYSGQTYDFTFPDGQYSIDSLNDYLNQEIVELGLSDKLIIFSSDTATSRVVLIFQDPQSTYIDFTIGNSTREVLGFNSRLVPSQPVVGTQVTALAELADSVAQFNRVNSFLIQSDLVSNGIPTNSTASGVIASIPIDVRPGSQIVYAPRNPTRIDASELVGNSKSYINMRLRDQLERPVNTNTEKWTVLVTLEYYVWATAPK